MRKRRTRQASLEKGRMTNIQYIQRYSCLNKWSDSLNLLLRWKVNIRNSHVMVKSKMLLHSAVWNKYHVHNVYPAYGSIAFAYSYKIFDFPNSEFWILQKPVLHACVCEHVYALSFSIKRIYFTSHFTFDVRQCDNNNNNNTHTHTHNASNNGTTWFPIR